MNAFDSFHAPWKSIKFNEMKISKIPPCWWCYGIFMIHTLSSCTHLSLSLSPSSFFIIVMIRAVNLAFMLNIFALSKQKWMRGLFWMMPPSCSPFILTIINQHDIQKIYRDTHNCRYMNNIWRDMNMMKILFILEIIWDHFNCKLEGFIESNKIN